MQCFYHRCALKTSGKQPFILFKSNLSKSSKDLLLQLHMDREKILKLFQESNRGRIDRLNEELHQTLMNYLSMFRGFVISPLHDLGGVPESVAEINKSPLCKMYTFNWTDSISETQMNIVGDSFVELTSMLFNYGLWLMKWSILVAPQAPISNLNYNFHLSNLTISYLIRAAALFRYVRVRLGKYLLEIGQNIFGSDLDPDVACAYEYQCYGEVHEFIFLSLILNKRARRKQSNIPDDSLVELIRLARITQEEYLHSEKSIHLIPERRLKKWHVYLLMKVTLFRSWEYLLIIHERYSLQPTIDIDYQELEEKALWQKCEQCFQLINRLCVKYNNYSKEFGKNNPNSWTNRLVDSKKFLKNITTYMAIVKEEIRDRKPNVMMKIVIAPEKKVNELIKRESFNLPKLHEFWTVNVCLEFGVEIFLPNFDPMAITNINIKLNDFMPIWSRKFTSLKKTNKYLENFDEVLTEKQPAFRQACLKLKQLRQEFQTFINEEPPKTFSNVNENKQKLLSYFNAYLSWLSGLSQDRLNRIFGYAWTSSIDPNNHCMIFDAEYEICSNVFNLGLWLMKSVNILLELKPEKDLTSSEHEFIIQNLREAAGIFQYLLDRTKTTKHLSENDFDFCEPILKSFRNQCLAEAEEFLLLLTNINWIQLKISIRVMQLYWTISEDLQYCLEKNKDECQEKLQWRTYCQMKSYLYKSFGYFFLSEMFPTSGERTAASLQKCQTLLLFFRKHMSEYTNNKQLLTDDSKLDLFNQLIEQRFQSMCRHFALNNHDNYMKKYDINLDTTTINRQLDSMIYLKPINFYLPVVDDYWIKDPILQQTLMELSPNQMGSPVKIKKLEELPLEKSGINSDLEEKSKQLSKQ